MTLWHHLKGYEQEMLGVLGCTCIKVVKCCNEKIGQGRGSAVPLEYEYRGILRTKRALNINLL